MQHDLVRIAAPLLAAAALAGMARGANPQERTWNFDSQSPGTAPAGWSIRQTRPSVALASWSLVSDPTAPSPPKVLALTKTVNEDPTFNLAIAENTSFQDVDITVKVKAVSGEVDQGGGPIWRCKDENNYYIARFNPLESNFRVYSVKNGQRRQLDSARVATEPGRWYTVRVTMVGSHILGYLDGKKLLEATNDVFPKAGMVGLWTKSDAATRFDDLHVRESRLQEAALLTLHRTLGLGGVHGRIDHLALDPAGKRLFVAALGNGTLEVIDLAAGKRTARVGGLQEPQSVLFLPGPQLLAVSCGGDGTVRTFDAGTLKEVARRDLGEDADNMRLDPSRNLLWVAYGNGALGSLKGGKLSPGGLVRLPGHPESFQIERSGRRAYVNVPDARQIAVVDLEKASVTTVWKIAAAEENFPMALDEAGHRLFVACRKPAALLVFDTRTGRMMANEPCVGDADEVFFDAPRNRIVVVGGEGFVDVFSGGSGGSYPRLARVRTAPGARTALFVPDGNLLYLAVPRHSEREAEVRVFRFTP